MADEWVLKIETEIGIPFTCAVDTVFEKGEVCRLTDPMTAVKSNGDNDIFACVVQSEKLSNSKTRLTGYRGGYFEATINGTCTAGDSLVTDSSTGGSNKLAAATANEENVVAIAMETATDEERILVHLNPTVMKLA